MPEWSRLLRDIPGFPKPGIVFKDITPVLADGEAFAAAIADMAAPWRATPPDAVAGIESRGFIFGACAWALSFTWFEFYLPWNVMREPAPLVALELVCWLAVMLVVGPTIAWTWRLTGGEADRSPGG